MVCEVILGTITDPSGAVSNPAVVATISADFINVRMTVSGFTMTSTLLQRDRRWRSVVQNSRSQMFQYWAWPLAFEHGDLLSKSQDFKSRVASAVAEDADHREQGQDEFGTNSLL